MADIIAVCKNQPGIESVALTTNAFKLAKLFPAYRAAGLDKLNISIDNFDPDVFFEITGKRECRNILNALDGILADGFADIKVNTLLLRLYVDRTVPDALHFVRQRPVTLRFIELMQTQDSFGYFSQQHLSAATIERQLIAQGWQLLPRHAHAGPAREYRHPDFAGGIDFIAPYSEDFSSCNRLRVTAQGKMHLCLFGGIAYDIRPYLRSDDPLGLQDYLFELITEKPKQHYLHDKKVGLIRDLSMIGEVKTMSPAPAFRPLNIHVLTVTDTRSRKKTAARRLPQPSRYRSRTPFWPRATCAATSCTTSAPG